MTDNGLPGQKRSKLFVTRLRELLALGGLRFNSCGIEFVRQVTDPSSVHEVVCSARMAKLRSDEVPSDTLPDVRYWRWLGYPPANANPCLLRTECEGQFPGVWVSAEGVVETFRSKVIITLHAARIYLAQRALASPPGFLLAQARSGGAKGVTTSSPLRPAVSTRALLIVCARASVAPRIAS
jgi:hypothetical protein